MSRARQGLAAGEGLVPIGRVDRPHGLSGEVRITASGPTLGRLSAGAFVQARGGEGRRTRLCLASVRGTEPRLIARFEGVVTREEAAALRGLTLAVAEEELPALDEPNVFYVRDLVGCQVWAGSVSLGLVTAVHEGSANDALEVGRDGAGLLLPFTQDAIVSLDLATRRIDIRPDLLDEEALRHWRA